MFAQKPQTESTQLDQAITAAHLVLDSYPPHSPEYAKTVEQLSKLYALKTPETPSRVSPDTLAIVLGNLVGIVVIVGHERAHVVTSKALGFVMKAAR